MDFNLTGLLFIIGGLIMALTLHEFAHAWASDLLGDRTARNEGRLTVNPIAHIDPFMTVLLPLLLIIAQSPVIFGAAKPVPFNPWAVRYGKWGAALVAAAGPAMNIVLAVFFALWIQVAPVSSAMMPLFISLISINVAFAVFNLLPIPPLDGSRILYAALPAPAREVMDNIERYGLVIIFGLLLLAGPIVMPFISAIVGFFMQLLVPGMTGLST